MTVPHRLGDGGLGAAATASGLGCPAVRGRSLVAFNSATHSDNKIHDDAVAQRFGFTGGLVPGVDVYAYLSWGPASAWGLDWLEHGTMQARFGKPAYDGDEVQVEADDGDGAIDLRLRNAAGDLLSEGTATLAGQPAPDPARYPTAPLPVVRPAASPQSLAAGTVLGTWEVEWRADAASAYLADARETLAVYADEGVAHPGWVLRQANRILAANVVLGPWIHVGSEVAHHGVVRDGQTVSCRGRVAAEYERKGHRFVQLDLLVSADDRPVATIDHTAIYLPRQVSEAS